MPTPTFANLGFEAAGATPGAALAWTLSFHSSAEEIASYAPPAERPQEDFERAWLSNDLFLHAFGPTSLEPSLFDTNPQSIENFEEEWSSNESFLFELGSIAAADFDPGVAVKLVENFDGLWANNQAFLFALTPGALAPPHADPFESGWRSNQSFLFAFTAPNLNPATFDAAGTPEPVEDFEELWPNVRMTTV